MTCTIRKPPGNSTTSRPLGVRMRPDLSAQRQVSQGQVYWIVKEPLGLRYFRFHEEEYRLLTWLDGQATIDGLCERFAEAFCPQRLRPAQVQQFLVRLHESGLVLSEAGGQSEPLRHRAEQRRRRGWLGSWSNLLAIRFRGVDPQPLLDVIYPRLKWLFHPTAQFAACAIVLLAMLLVLVHFGEFRARLPTLGEFFRGGNLPWLMLALVITKVLHEMGHALTCKHYGGECHEMGAMLLVFTPVLYCNVSDSWLLPNKWHRIAISAAGMYVEIVLAALATLLWWHTEPGLLHYLALDVMVIASVSTLVFNSNPLLKYDGYYILSDLVELPNLAQRASDRLRQMLLGWTVGVPETADPFTPRAQSWLALYAVASAVYRWLVLLSILWLLHKFFEPYRLQIVGQVLAVVTLYGLLVDPLRRLALFLQTPGRTDQVKMSRLWATVGLASVLAAASFLVPLPARVFCTLELRPHESAAVYVGTRGRLAEIYVEPGQTVRAGAPLARLENDELIAEIAALEGQRSLLGVRLEAMQRQRFGDNAAAFKLAHLEESLAATERQLERRRQDADRLLVRAPFDGTVLPPPTVQPPPPVDGALPQWSGSPLDARNLGTWLDETVLLCRLGDPNRYEAVLVVDQADVELVRPEQSVRLWLDQLPCSTIDSVVREVARSDLKVSPRNLSARAGGDLATRTDAAGIDRPLSTSYQARVFPIDAPPGALRTGLRGRARIAAGSRTTAQIVGRYIQQTLHFRL